jgi:hypothetical protein
VIERGRIIPALPECEIEVTNRGTSHFELHVVPRWLRSVSRVQLDHLTIAAMIGVITTSVTEINSSDERDVVFKTRRMTDEDHLLVVRSASANPLVEEGLAPGLGDLDRKARILLGVESDSITMRTPQQRSNVNAPLYRSDQESHNRSSVL